VRLNKLPKVAGCATCTLGVSRKMDAQAALQKARRLKAEALELNER